MEVIKEIKRVCTSMSACLASICYQLFSQIRKGKKKKPIKSL